MRCLVLADALRDAGARTRFVCRDLHGHLGARIEARGHGVRMLPAATEEAPVAQTGDPPHARWLPVPQALDAAQTRAALDDDGSDGVPRWLVVDHYALDARWERAAVRPGTRLLAIDDLADRPHECDLLLDQNLGREAADYDALVPERTRRLIGPRFALLGPAFARARPASLARRDGRPVERILVAMGGTDPGDATGAVLAALAERPPPALAAIDVVLGGTAPWLDRVRTRAEAMPVPTTLHVDTDDMPGLMTRADLAIGAAGSSAWERCCLGLPTLMLVLADNQRAAAQALDAAGAGLRVGRIDDHDLHGILIRALAIPASPDRLSTMSRTAAAITDGRGVGRIAKTLTGRGR